MRKLVSDVVAHIRAYEMLPENCALFVGFSGGADSVCLLHLLNSVKRLLKLHSLTAVHINHGLRGAESERDEAFCRTFCEEQGILFQAARVDVSGTRNEQGGSVEEVARMLRYEALWRIAGTAADNAVPVRLAVAHHADDQAETILFQLLRGSGLSGLSGMQPVRADGLIRPLLFTPHAEILRYLKAEGLSFVTDSSNTEPVYARNRLRMEVLPLLTEINGQAARHILAAGERCAEADRYLREEAARLLDDLIGEVPRPNAAAGWESGALSEEAADGKSRVLCIRRRGLKEKARILRRYVIIEALTRLKVPLRDWGEVHYAAIDAAFSKGTGVQLHLPGGVSLQNERTVTVLRTIG